MVTRRKRKPARKGRPTKRTPDVRAAVLKALRAGHPVKTSARLAGIAPSTLFAWQGADPDFSDRVEAAVAHAQARLHRVVMRGASRSPKLALEVLARRWPEEYGRLDRSKVQVSGELTHTSTIDWSKLTEAELDTVEAVLLKARSGGPKEDTGGSGEG